MSSICLSDIKIAPSGNYHIVNAQPLYTSRFQKVLKYHEPGLAPVQDSSGAYHINLKGKEAYSCRFKRTFGFYAGLAAVESEEGHFHILPDGKSLYDEKYAWCGNYQEGYCAVRSENGEAFHIDRTGQKLYEATYAYVGDFKDGIAVIHNERGCTHINDKGQFIHRRWFPYLDLFHKGFARAKDYTGWFHITPQGEEIYSERFQELEPFYNGVAVAVDKQGRTVFLNETGQIVHMLKKVESQNNTYDLSADMTGFWKLEILKLAVKFKIMDYLPSSCEEIAQQIKVPEDKTERFMRALEEINIVKKLNQIYYLTKKGQLLIPCHLSFMAAAVEMWGAVQEQWKNLDNTLKNKNHTYHPTFKEKNSDPQEVYLYQRAIDGYARLDFSDVHKWVDWQNHNSILGLGRSSVTAIQVILQNYPHMRGTLYNENLPINNFKIPRELNSRLNKYYFNLFRIWPNLIYDGVILPRFIHYFPDIEARLLLSLVKKSLVKTGRIYIFELTLSETNPKGGVLDINMLAESGGQLRSLLQWKGLVSSVEMKISKFDEILPHLHLLTIENVTS